MLITCIYKIFTLFLHYNLKFIVMTYKLIISKVLNEPLFTLIYKDKQHVKHVISFTHLSDYYDYLTVLISND